MSSSVISIEGLGKRYRLFRSPRDRLKEALGLTRFARVPFQEFWALRDLDFEVDHGERVGIIGRNGAGKSTLLKIISGRIAPTEGRIRVDGTVQALLELGTGFHPEFTGLENIRASLNYQGLSRRLIKEREEDIIDFAELGEFIERPLKTYSAGMYARLAFAVATSVDPEVLIIDEVLGAGDAYFAGKSIDRMKRLATEKGATVLFVSHDTSMVEMLCDRCIWIERGEKKMDGAASAVSRAYAAMIRELTSARLRNQNQLAARAHGARGIATANAGRVQKVVRFIRESPPRLYVRSVTVSGRENTDLRVDVGTPQDNSIEYESFVLTDDASQWGEPASVEGAPARLVSPVAGHGSAVVFSLGAGWAAADAELRVRSWAEEGARARVEVLANDTYELVGIIEAERNGERTDTLRVPVDLIRRLSRVAGLETGHDGALVNGDGVAAASVEFPEGDVVDAEGRVAITDVSLEVNGTTGAVAKTFDELRVHIDYAVRGTPVEAVFDVCIHRLGIIALQTVSTLTEDFPALPDVVEGRGRATLVIPSLPLGAGSYLMTVGIFPSLDYRSRDTERTAYVLHDRRYRLEVEQPELVAIDLGMCRGAVRWQLAQPAPQP